MPNLMQAFQDKFREKRAALVDAVRQREAEVISTNTMPPKVEAQCFRSRLEPMIHGLFPKVEREIVLKEIADNVVILTPDNIAQVLEQESFDSDARVLANMYIASIGGKPLSEEESCPVGKNDGVRSYVSMKYLSNEDKYSDWIVHEAAHVFHSCKRTMLGLKETRTREFLLNIKFKEWETFAYSCEVYSRICELGKTRAARMKLAEEAIVEFEPPDERVNMEKFHAGLRSAAASRNGWKKILEICNA